jgi:transcriptional regulator with XRE-family HTH domain
VWAGKPTLRQLADASGGLVSHATIGDVLNGKRMPREKTMVLFLKACGITDIPTWTVTWQHLRTRRREAEHRPAGPAQLPRPD